MREMGVSGFVCRKWWEMSVPIEPIPSCVSVLLVHSSITCAASICTGRTVLTTWNLISSMPCMHRIQVYRCDSSPKGPPLLPARDKYFRSSFARLPFLFFRSFVGPNYSCPPIPSSFYSLYHISSNHQPYIVLDTTQLHTQHNQSINHSGMYLSFPYQRNHSKFALSTEELQVSKY